jgi:hypothetical protein
MIFLVAFVVFNFPTVYLLEKLGLSKTVSFSLFKLTYYLVPYLRSRNSIWCMG